MVWIGRRPDDREGGGAVGRYRRGFDQRWRREARVCEIAKKGVKGFGFLFWVCGFAGSGLIDARAEQRCGYFDCARAGLVRSWL
ncbi:hypothetical protein M0R45_016233 [Rubus argutus]|uniref:Uncharacterized protein n=1 Tax=Rubus argutus TaxID=59490 RepID=A0AAW1XUH2_RUBAR